MGDRGLDSHPTPPLIPPLWGECGYLSSHRVKRALSGLCAFPKDPWERRSPGEHSLRERGSERKKNIDRLRLDCGNVEKAFVLKFCLKKINYNVRTSLKNYQDRKSVV